MQNKMETERLLLDRLNLGDAQFMLELINTPGWLRFIGDKEIRTLEGTVVYLEKLEVDPSGFCLSITRKDQQVPVGIISFIQREYLSHPDIGFALLPGHEKLGFAYEAAMVVLAEAMNHYPLVYAMVLPDNVNSIRLIEKMGLTYEKEIQADDELLSLYVITQEEFQKGK